MTTPADLHAHRALYDCYVTAALLIRIMETSGWDAPRMAGVVSAPTAAGQDVMPFGKYRGRAIAEVAKRDPGYLRWMLNSIPDLKPALRTALQKQVNQED